MASTTRSTTRSRAGTAPRRADARRNAQAILEAAVRCLSARPDASVGEIAEAAGVGRVTLYGHFPSRGELVEAVLVHQLERGEQVLGPLDLDGDPRAALARLVEASWRLVDESRGILAAAQAELPLGRIRDLHAAPAARVEQLVARGQAEGVFRSDLPVSWLVATLHHVIHGAADEIGAGRLDEADAARYVTATVLSAYSPDAVPVAATGA